MRHYPNLTLGLHQTSSASPLIYFRYDLSRPASSGSDQLSVLSRLVDTPSISQPGELVGLSLSTAHSNVNRPISPIQSNKVQSLPSNQKSCQFHKLSQNCPKTMSPVRKFAIINYPGNLVNRPLVDVITSNLKSNSSQGLG